jgi:hypothetical protein
MLMLRSVLSNMRYIRDVPSSHRKRTSDRCSRVRNDTVEEREERIIRRKLVRDHIGPKRCDDLRERCHRRLGLSAVQFGSSKDCIVGLHLIVSSTPRIYPGNYSR